LIVFAIFARVHAVLTLNSVTSSKGPFLMSIMETSSLTVGSIVKGRVAYQEVVHRAPYFKVVSVCGDFCHLQPLTPRREKAGCAFWTKDFEVEVVTGPFIPLPSHLEV
jgi:hypothetical protein